MAEAARRDPPPSPGDRAPLRRVVGAHGAIAVIAIAALVPLFANLGASTLWADEADTAVFARTIAATGLPHAWDGTTFTDSDEGRRLTPGLLLVGTPWLPYYAAAASIAVLGETSFAARLPFALAGFATIILLYALVWRWTGDRLAAAIAAALLLGSVQFLIYARQCRHYALNMALSVALLVAFPRLEHGRADWLFAALAVLLFHTHPLPAAVTLAVLGAATLVHPAFRAARRGFWRSLPAVLVLTVPWVLVARGGWSENARPLFQPADLAVRVLQLLYEGSVAVPYVGLAVLAAVAARRLDARARVLLLLCAALFAGYALATPIVQSPRQMWEYGLRYTSALLPLGAAATGVLVARAARGRAAVAIPIAALFAVTHVPGNLARWAIASSQPAPADPPAPQHAALHRPEHAIDLVLRTELPAFARELVETSPGTDAKLIGFLQSHAQPGDRLVTNYAWEPLSFHTRLPQADKVLPSYPIYADARAAGLPDYVFSPDTARWLVWRAPWEDYQDYRWADVAARIRAAGGVLVAVASFPETIWENRENLHFRRFPGVGYLYPRAVELVYPPAHVWRVDRAEAAVTPPADAPVRSPAPGAPRDARE